MADNVTRGDTTNDDIEVAAAEAAFSGDTTQVQLIALADIAGAEGARTATLLPTDATAGIKVNLGADNDVTVSGTVTVDLGANNDVTIDNSSIVHAEDSAHTTTDAGVMALGVRRDTGSTLASADGDYTPMQFDSSGNLRVNVAGNDAGSATLTDDAAFTAASDTIVLMGAAATSDTVDAGDAGALAMDTNRNLKVSIEADNAGIGGGTQYTEDAAAAANPVGNATILVRDDALGGSLTTTDGDNVAQRGNNKGEAYVKDTDAAALLTTIDADTSSMNTDLGTIAGAVSGTEMQVDIVSGTVTANLSATDNAVLDNIDTNTSAGASHYRNIDANAEAAIKGSAGTLFWLHAMNMTAAVAYVHLYDATTASVTPGTTTPDYTFPIPTLGDTNGAGFVLNFGGNGQAFSNAITLVVTTTTDGSTGDPGTNGVFINAGYT